MFKSLRLNLEFRQIGKELLTAISLYAMVLIYQGYLYGVSDQSQILPCIWAQDHPEAYPNDHYVQTYIHSPVNERTIFHFLFRYLGYASPWVVFVWHAFLSVALILAWVRISAFFIKNKIFQWISIALVLTLGYHTHTGSNEIYYNMVVPSLVAKALGSWALYYWLIVRYTRSSILLIAATLVQPLVGLQLFLITTVASLMDLLARKRIRNLQWQPIVFYLLLISPWMYLLILNNGGGDDPKTFFDIIEFRLPHHFFASTFGWFNMIITAGFAVLTIIFFKEKMRWLFITLIVGCVVYEAGVEWKQIPVVLYTQWWKTTLWMEVFAFIAIGVYIEKLFTPNDRFLKLNIILPIIFIGLVAFYRLGGTSENGISYMFPWAKKVSTEVDISMQAGKVTPPDALFIIPIEMTAFKWYSKRNAYVDYKTMLHQETFLKEWYARIQDVYHFGIEEKTGGFNVHNFSRYLLEDPSPLSIQQWKRMGITHIISTRPGLVDFDLLGQNERYYIYRLR